MSEKTGHHASQEALKMHGNPDTRDHIEVATRTLSFYETVAREKEAVQ
jgi:hypothetical protein